MPRPLDPHRDNTRGTFEDSFLWVFVSEIFNLGIFGLFVGFVGWFLWQLVQLVRWLFLKALSAWLF